MMFFDKKKKAVKKLEKLAELNNNNINVESVKNLITSALLLGNIEPDKAVASFESFLASGIVPNLYF